jgi:hypothetical protein
VLAGCLGDCVHVAGVTRFLRVAEQQGHATFFTGPATDPEALAEAVEQFQPDVIGLSYRLTPENLPPLLQQLRPMLEAIGLEGRRLAFAGTPPVVEVARRLGEDLFEAYYEGGESAAQVRRYLELEHWENEGKEAYPQDPIERIRWKAPLPLLRHHYGVPAATIEPTVEGIRQIAESGALDVISLGADQDAQEHFFHPESQRPSSAGAGGVPFRTEEDLHRLYAASRRGNWPLMRSYAGTRDHLRYAEMLVRIIHNAWCATPLFWFNAMDGRGPSPLVRSIREHIGLMNWHGARGIPIEANEPYHWGMRDAPDVIVCTAAYLHAHNARQAGVHDYITTYMFESPPHLNNRMDLARSLAQFALVESLRDDDFRIWRQTRTGLLSYPIQPAQARAHLAQSVALQMTARPHILHVVGYTEADHAASAQEVIESGDMARYVAEVALRGSPDAAADALVQERKEELIYETEILLEAIRTLSTEQTEPFSDPATLGRAVRLGLLDAPQLVNNPYAPGAVRTRGIEGAIRAVDEEGNPISERDRVREVLRRVQT